MKRSDAIPARLQVVAVAVLNDELCPTDSAGWLLVDDEVIAAHTGYSERLVRLVWQELADMGAAQIGRADASLAGCRLVRPGAHRVWVTAAAAGAQVSA